MSDKKSPVRKDSGRDRVGSGKMVSSAPSAKAASPKALTSSKAISSSDDGKAGKKRLHPGSVLGISSKNLSEQKTDDDDKKPANKKKKTGAPNTTSTTVTTLTKSELTTTETDGGGTSTIDSSDSISESSLENPIGSPSSSKGRLGVPLSERQQMAMLMQISKADTDASDVIVSSGDHPQSPHTVFSNSRRTPISIKRLNKRNEKGETQLHLACIKGDGRRVRKLIKGGADVNIKDFAGWAPLHEACNHGFVAIAKYLLKAGADANAKGLDDDTPLHDAAMNGHEKLVKLLLRLGANPNQANSKGKTPLDATNAIKPNIKALLMCEDVSTLASSDDEGASDDGDPLTSDEEEDYDSFGVASTTKEDADEFAAASSVTDEFTSAGQGAKKLRDRKSGNENGDKPVSSSPRFRHRKKSYPDSKTKAESGNSTPDSPRSMQLQMLRAAAEAEYAFQSDDDDSGISNKEKRGKGKVVSKGKRLDALKRDQSQSLQRVARVTLIPWKLTLGGPMSIK